MVDWSLIIPVGLILIVLLVIVLLRNRRDKKELEQQLNQDYKKPKDEEGDADIEDTKQV